MEKEYPEKKRLISCRNFKCEQNNNGNCLSARITLVPLGGIIDHVKCVEASEKEDEAKG